METTPVRGATCGQVRQTPMQLLTGVSTMLVVGAVGLAVVGGCLIIIDDGSGMAIILGIVAAGIGLLVAVVMAALLWLMARRPRAGALAAGLVAVSVVVGSLAAMVAVPTEDGLWFLVPAVGVLVLAVWALVPRR